MTNNKRILRPVALILAFLVGFASIGVSMDRHICQGRVKSISLFGKAKTCLEMNSQQSGVSSCKKHHHCKHSKKKTKPCCHNEASYTKLPVNIALGSATTIASPVYTAPCLVAVVPAYRAMFSTSEQESLPVFKIHADFNLPRDRYVLFENFRL